MSIDGRRVSARDLADRGRTWTDRLAEVERVRPGDPIVLALDSGIDHLALLYAAWHLGLRVVEVPPTSTSAVVSEAVRRTDAVVLVVDGDCTKRLLGVDEGRDAQHVDHEIPTMSGDARTVVMRSFKSESARGPSRATRRLSDTRLDDLLAEQPEAVFFTSGSTATSKGVRLRWSHLLDKGRAVLSFYGAEATRCVYPVLPMSHAYGLYLILATLAAGSNLVLTRESAEIPSVVRGAIDGGARTLVCPPKLGRLILGRDSIDPRLRDQLAVVSLGGAATPPHVAQRILSNLPNTRVVLSYGLVETYSTICCLDLRKDPAKLASVGPFRWGAAGELRDPITGAQVPAGQRGELCIARPITDGYLGGDPSPSHFTADGLLRTGDLAEMDEDGYVFLKGRVKDIFKLGSLTVDPSEIEEVLASHPAVADCAAYMSTATGDSILAAVTTRSPADATMLEDIREHCRARLAPQMVPRRVLSVAAIPRNPLGKIQRAKVEELLANALEGRS